MLTCDLSFMQHFMEFAVMCGQQQTEKGKDKAAEEFCQEFANNREEGLLSEKQLPVWSIHNDSTNHFCVSNSSSSSPLLLSRPSGAAGVKSPHHTELYYILQQDWVGIGSKHGCKQVVLKHQHRSEKEAEETQPAREDEDIDVSNLEQVPASNNRHETSSENVLTQLGAIEPHSSGADSGGGRQHRPSPFAAAAAAAATTTAAVGAGQQQASGERLEQKQQQHEKRHQLSPAASITAEVQRVSIDDQLGNQQHKEEKSAGAAAGANPEQQKKSSPESGRFERAGRALRKHAAIEDEEHLLETSAAEHQQHALQPQQQQQQHPLVVPALHVVGLHQHQQKISPSAGILPPPPSQCSSSSLPSVSPLLSPEHHQLALASASTAAANVAIARPSPQHPSPSTPQPPTIDPTTAAIQLVLLQHQQQQQQQHHQMPGLKHESVSHEELLMNTLVQQQANREQLLAAAAAAAANCSWLSNSAAAISTGQQQQQQTMSTLASLIGQMQQQMPAEQQIANAEPQLLEAQASRLAAIQEEHLQQQQQQQPISDISRVFSSRNHSTESTASTGGTSVVGALGGMEPIPRKQDIQTDIRMNRGRFQLVRKRGRSEVWNLFGQVVDTLTGARLPYVACYACKVLYTDTGGGTGNMTRHRCSMGSSYRSAVRRSSSDTTVGNDSMSANQSSSFESIIGGGTMHSSSFILGGGSCSYQGSSFGATSPHVELEELAQSQQQPQQQQQLLSVAASSSASSQQQQKQASLEKEQLQQQQQQKVWSVTAAGAREAFAQSASSGFLSAGSTTSAGSSIPPMASASSLSMDSTGIPHYQQLSVNLSHPSMLMSRLLSGSASAGSSSALSPSCCLPPPSAASLPPSSAEQHYYPQQHQQQGHHHQQQQQQQQQAIGLLSTLSANPAAAAASIAANTPMAAASTVDAISASAPPILPRPSAIGSGHHFTQADKQVFTQAVMQFCAQDMHNWDVVEGQGFKNLIDTVLFIGRRSNGDPNANTYDPVRRLIPTAKQLKEVFFTQKRAVLCATGRDLEQVKSFGLALNCQRLEFCGEQHYVISATYVTDDWRITRRTLRVERMISPGGRHKQIGPVLADVLHEFQLEDVKLILLAVDTNIGASEAAQQELFGPLPGNVQLLANANLALNQILAQSIAECPDSAKISDFTKLCSRAIYAICALDRRGLFPVADVLCRRLRQFQSADGAGDIPADYTNGIYPAIKFLKEHCAEILTFLDCEGPLDEHHEDLVADLRNVNWEMATELEMFLEPFHETAQIFTDSRQPHFQRILPEWIALSYECQHSSIDDTSVGPSASLQSAMPPDHHQQPQQQPMKSPNTIQQQQQPAAEERMSPAPICGSSGTPEWIRAVRQRANHRLKEWAAANIKMEHRMATVLNPRLRQLPLMCSESERLAIYEKIREVVGLSRPRRDIGVQGPCEPFKKRRRFLDRLEDCAMEEDDELDCYLRTTFSHDQSKNIFEFWSSVGEVHFPRLAQLARFLLATSGAPTPIPVDQPSAGRLEPSDIATLLNLRPDVLNSVNSQLDHHRAQQQKLRQHPAPMD